MMKPMFLRDVENNPQPGTYRDAINLMKAGGAEYPQIWHMLAYRTEAAKHLSEFTQAMLREESPLSPGIRELIAAYTSHQNDCPF